MTDAKQSWFSRQSQEVISLLKASNYSMSTERDIEIVPADYEDDGENDIAVASTSSLPPSNCIPGDIMGHPQSEEYWHAEDMSRFKVQIADTAMERVKDVFIKSELGIPSLEVTLATWTAVSGLIVGLVLGGIRDQHRSMGDFDAKNQITSYLSQQDAFKRKMDYVMIRYMKSGVKHGLKYGTVGGLGMLIMGCIAAARDNFYVTDLIIGCGGSASLYSWHRGFRAMAASGLMGLIIGSGLLLPLVIAQQLSGYSCHDLYHRAKQEHYETFLIMNKNRKKQMEIVKDGGSQMLQWASSVIKQDKEAAKAEGEEWGLLRERLREESKQGVSPTPSLIRS